MAIRFPLELAEISQADDASPVHLCGSVVIKRGMYTVRIVVLPKAVQLLRKIIGISEERLVKKFSTDCSDQSLDEGMR